MATEKQAIDPQAKLRRENEELRAQLGEAQETLRAIREGEVDAVVVSGSQGEQVFSLVGAESVYRLIVETIQEAACTLEFDGTILYCNAQFGEFLKRPLEQILGRPLEQFVAPDNRAAAGALLTIAREQPVRQRLVLQDSQGCWVPVHVSANLLNQPGNPSICLVATDLTELENSTELIQRLHRQQEALRENEARLHRAKEELEHRVRERTSELSRTVDTLQGEVSRRITAEKVLRRKSEQLRAMAAELTLAEQRERRRLAEVLHDNLQQLLVGAKLRLGVLGHTGQAHTRQVADEVQDLLDQSIECSRSLTGELSPPILRQGGLAAALEWLAVWMHQKHALHVHLQTRENAVPETDDVKIILFQSARELLFNAAKHAGVDHACVRLESAHDHIELSVSDEGVGFDPDTAIAEAGQEGRFGLFSIRERLELLGGSLEIDSAPGRGSRFRLWMPRKAAAAKEAPAEPAAPRGSAPAAAVHARGEATPARQKIRVLLVDDHTVVRQGLCRLLQEEPDVDIVAEASDGRSAVELACRLRPEVVLMDISMPGMDGIEATRIIHAQCPDVRVIGLSMFEQGEAAVRMRQAGAVDYLTKSGPSDLLLATIRANAGPS